MFTSLAKGTLEIGDRSLDGFAASYEMRQEIAHDWGQKLMQEGLDLGLSYEQSFFRAKRFWYGDETTGDPGLRAILFDKQIPVENDLKYFQLNHTYAIGPDGKPWATPFPKMGLMQTLGLPVPTTFAEAGAGLSIDENGRIIDETVGGGINTGLAGLEKVPDLVVDMDPDDSAFEGGAKDAKSDSSPSRKFGSYRRYPGYSRSGGSSGGGYLPNMRALPRGSGARFDGIQNINTSNPYIRRANVYKQTDLVRAWKAEAMAVGMELMVGDFDSWYMERRVSERTGTLDIRGFSEFASNLYGLYEDAKREMDQRVESYWKLEKLADGQVLSTKPDLPNISSGETAGIVRRMARNLVQNTPNVEVLSKFDDDSPQGIFARHILTSKIIGSDEYSSDMQQNLFATAKTALTLGFATVVPSLLQDAGGSWFIDYDTIHYRDVFPEPGAKDIRKAEYVFVRRYLTKGEVVQMIREKTAGWDHVALRTMLE